MKVLRKIAVCLLGLAMVMPACYGLEDKRIVLDQCGITEAGEVVVNGYVAGRAEADVGLVITRPGVRPAYVWQTETEHSIGNAARFSFPTISAKENDIRSGDTVTVSAAGCISAQAVLKDLTEKPAERLYISPTGSDQNPGTAEAPFATLERARDAVREIKARTGGVLLNNIEVVLQDGTYYRSEPFVLAEEDSGVGGYRVIYRAAQTGGAMLSGASILVEGWRSEGGGIYSAPLTGMDSVQALFEEGTDGPKTAWPARFPNKNNPPEDALLYPADNYLYAASGDKNGFSVADQDAIPPISDPYALETVFWNGGPDGFWRWSMVIQPCTLEGRQITFRHGSTDEVVGGGSAYYLQGAKEFLDQPGEFWYDRDNGRLYYYPYGDPDTIQVRVSTLGNLIETTGGGTVGGVDFQGLALTGGTRTECWNPVGNLFYLTNAQDIRIQACRLFESLGGGVFLHDHCHDIAVENCEIHDLGSAGVSLSSYARTAEERISNCQIVNNHIYDFGKMFPQHSGILLYEASGNYVAHNLIHGGPRTGIYLFSNPSKTLIGTTIDGVLVTKENNERFRRCHNNVIEFNELYNCMWDSQDGGLIYSYGVHDNFYYNNILRDSACPTSFYVPLYFDDGSDRTTAENNLIYNHDWQNTRGGIMCDVMLKGSYNRYCNNIVACNGNGAEYKGVYGVSSPSSHPGWADDPGELSQHYTMTHNIAYRTGTDSDTRGGQTVTYRMLNDAYLPEILLFDTPESADYNLFYNPGMPDKDPTDGDNYIVRGDGIGLFNSKWYNWNKWQNTASFDQHSNLADPKFVNPENNDYRLLPDSPAHELGIHEIWTDAIGLTADYPYADQTDTPARLYIRGEEQNVNSYTISAKTGIPQQLQLTVRSQDGYILDDEHVRFSFAGSNPGVADVTENGILLPRCAGEAVFTATASSNGKNVSTTFRVVIQDAGVRFSDQAGNQLFGQFDSETQAVTAYITGNISGQAIAAAYLDGQLTGLFTSKVQQGSSLIFQLPGQVDTVQFFIWDTLQEMHPVKEKMILTRAASDG